MEKLDFIWRDSIASSKENGIYKCNVCGCKIYDANTKENNGILLDNKGREEAALTCPECENVVAFVK